MIILQIRIGKKKKKKKKQPLKLAEFTQNSGSGNFQ